MKWYWYSYILTLVLLVTLGVLFRLFFVPGETSKAVLSPLPDFLTLASNKQVASINLFLPFLHEVFGSESQPAVTAKAALLYDMKQEKMLYGKDVSVRLPMASITKIMTAIIALEHSNPNDTYIVERDDLVGENSMGLTPGEVVTVEELLYGLILVSGNDAAEVLARNSPFGRDGFVDAMNDKARALGLTNTHFTNPSGLQGEGKQYTTASDLLVITEYALKHFPLFRKVVATTEYTIPYSKDHKAFYLSNETNLLTTYPGVKGVKTGFTPEAGLCLVTYYEDRDKELIGIILGSENRRSDMAHLLDYSLAKLGVKVKHNVY